MKWIKRAGIVILLLLLLLNIGILLSGKTYLYSVLRHTILSGKTGPDIDELSLFPMREVDNDKPRPWPRASAYNQSAPGSAAAAHMTAYQTAAYVVIRNDSLLYEQYWEPFSESSVSNSFSMAKTITSILIGCAIRDGLIKSVDQPVSDFLPAFREWPKSKITLQHLLTMSSGIGFTESYGSPFAWPAEAYYGEDVNGITLSAEADQEPGRTWFYKGGDSQLLGMVLQAATGKHLADYAADRLWKPLGAEDKAFWSLDRKDGMEKASCCFYSTARDYARIPSLFMKKGNWTGIQIVDSSYVDESLKAADLVDREGVKNVKYGFQWWLMKHRGYDVFYMRGIRGQYAWCIPALQMVVVRLGHKRAAKTGDEFPEGDRVYLDAALAMR